jgi:hypothetical protein
MHGSEERNKSFVAGRSQGSWIGCGHDFRLIVPFVGAYLGFMPSERPLTIEILDMRTRNLVSCHSGALGNGAGAASLLAATDRANASGQRALIAKLG